jgi:hypothetical protein
VLGVARRLFDAFHREGIVYCHWKSNQRLREGLEGLTDLDVLIQRGPYPKTAGLLAALGYKRFNAVPARAYPAVEDYLALDEPTGRLVHLHLHYGLTLGQEHLKGYQFPWASEYLSGRRLDEENAVFVPDPAVELVHFVLRYALKINLRHQVILAMGGVHLSEPFLSEYEWIKERTETGRILEVSRRLLGDGSVRVLQEMLDSSPTMKLLIRYRRAGRAELELCRTYGPVATALHKWRRERATLRASLGLRLMGLPIPLNRTLPNGGVIVAVLGADGSGKSTVVKALTRWLSWKLDVLPIYLGSGDGPSSVLRWPLRLLLRVFLKTGILSQAPPGDSTAGPAPRRPGVGTRVRRMLRVPWALVLTREKSEKLRRALRARSRGLVAICDRFPQDQVEGFNDGPLLGHWKHHASSLLRALAAWERTPYHIARRHPPDLVVKLNVSPEVALRRKPGMNSDDLRRRVEAVRSLRFPPHTRVLEVDADQPLEEVLLEVKRSVWKTME